jgi:hypothetical protein
VQRLQQLRATRLSAALDGHTAAVVQRGEWRMDPAEAAFEAQLMAAIAALTQA